jgi:hypothetical protein
MNRFDSVASVALAAVIALASASAQAAPAKSGAKPVPQKSSQPAPRVPVLKAPPKTYPPGPTSHQGSSPGHK